jgi:hypothetical protein
MTRQRLIALNPSTGLPSASLGTGRAGLGLVTETNVDDVLRRLRGVHPSIAGNEDFLHYLRGHKTVYSEAEKRELNLTLLDFDTPANNRFTFTQEFTFEDRDRRRTDMMLFVNGFPVALIENKSPTVPEAELEAFDQVQHTYTDRIPELLKFVQFGCVIGVRFISVEGRLRRSSAEDFEGKSDLKSPQKPLDRALFLRGLSDACPDALLGVPAPRGGWAR